MTQKYTYVIIRKDGKVDPIKLSGKNSIESIYAHLAEGERFVRVTTTKSELFTPTKNADQSIDRVWTVLDKMVVLPKPKPVVTPSSPEVPKTP